MENRTGCLSWLHEFMQVWMTGLIPRKPPQKVKEIVFSQQSPSNVSPSSQILSLSHQQLLDLQSHEPIFIDDKKTRKIWVDKDSRKPCISISARALTIAWIDDKSCWDWVQLDAAERDKISFGEAARLLRVNWFEVRGEFQCGSLLSPLTRYSVWIRMKFTALAGWEAWNSSPVVFSIKTKHSGQKCESGRYIFSLNKPLPDQQMAMTPYRFLKNTRWLEFEAGSFVAPENPSGKTCEIVEFSMTHVSEQCKQGILLESVRIMPCWLYDD